MSKWTKIEADDPGNFNAVYVQVKKETVCIAGGLFGEPDVYNMVVMSPDQFKRLTEKAD